MARSRRASTRAADGGSSAEKPPNLTMDCDEAKLLLARLETGELTGLEEPKYVYLASDVKHMYSEARYRGFYNKIRESYLKSTFPTFSIYRRKHAIIDSTLTTSQPTIPTVLRSWLRSAPVSAVPVVKVLPPVPQVRLRPLQVQSSSPTRPAQQLFPNRLVPCRLPWLPRLLLLLSLLELPVPP